MEGDEDEIARRDAVALHRSGHRPVEPDYKDSGKSLGRVVEGQVAGQ